MGNSRMRRYPALSYLLGAGALALLLPSALTLPRSGPQTLAEYAPVPGDSEGTSDVAEFASGTSSGIGFGSSKNGDSRVDDEDRKSNKIARKAGTKRCVGTPARQTEDRLSPPCIAFFEGDNGGATAQGVTRDEVVVVVATEKTESDPAAGQLIDCSTPPTPEDPPQDLVCKSYMKYFNERYQTYGRTVRLISSHNVKAAEVAERKPFAFGNFGNAENYFARNGILSVGYEGASRANYQATAGSLFSFRPDTEDYMKIGASYVCQDLAGQPARLSGNATDQNRTRKFAIWAEAANDYHKGMATKLQEQLTAQCGLNVDTIVYANDAANVARLREEGVTTVIFRHCYSCASGPTTVATNQGWFPEWVILGGQGGRGLDNNFYGRLANQAQWANAIGITYDYRRDTREEQPWFRAYREGCPDCPDFVATQRGASSAPAAYDMLQLLFYGIQSAGPKLTIANVDRGLHSIEADKSTSPYKPAAYFDPGNYTFVKDAARIWWDPSGFPPGSGTAGCWRLADGGNRFRAGEFGPTDARVKAPGPCQGDAFE